MGAEWPLTEARLHAVTMTGELADNFPDRATGVLAVLDRMAGLFEQPLQVFAGAPELLDHARISAQLLPLIASANWMASAIWLAQHCRDGVLIDIGSTTTDIVPLANGAVRNRGYTDHERLRYDELVYFGIVRTPLMAFAPKAPFGGGWVALMNEHFATAADVFRLTGELPAHADQWPAADQGPKDAAGSARRLARMIGCDRDAAPPADWVELAAYFRSVWVDRVAAAVENQSLAMGDVDAASPLIGAGTGRFLVRAVAERLNRPYRDVDTVLPIHGVASRFALADCLPAAAVAHLARGPI
jgi:probable H4MPT-linked C1 transfer pathway protein